MTMRTMLYHCLPRLGDIDQIICTQTMMNGAITLLDSAHNLQRIRQEQLNVFDNGSIMKNSCSYRKS